MPADWHVFEDFVGETCALLLVAVVVKAFAFGPQPWVAES
jgi:hypothetical protein